MKLTSRRPIELGMCGESAGSKPTGLNCPLNLAITNQRHPSAGFAVSACLPHGYATTCLQPCCYFKPLGSIRESDVLCMAKPLIDCHDTGADYKSCINKLDPHSTLPGWQTQQTGKPLSVLSHVHMQQQHILCHRQGVLPFLTLSSAQTAE